MSVDEQIRNQGQSDQDKRAQDLGKEDVADASTRDITRELGRGVSKGFALETGETGT